MSKLFETRILSFLLLLTTCFCSAQIYNFRKYGTEHGLPQSQALSMFQDDKGFMWFGTNFGGLSRFDGNTFVNYSKEDGLIDDAVYSITQNNKHEMVFGTSKGVSVYNHFTFKNFDEKNGLKNSWVFKVINDGEKVWIGTQMGVYIYENGHIRPFEKDSILSSSSVFSIFIDRDQNLWFATQEHGVIYYNIKQNAFRHFTEREGLLNSQIFSFCQTNDGTILVGTSSGLNKINLKFEVSSATEIANNQNICYWASLQNMGDEFYFGTRSEGLLRYDFRNHNLKVFSAGNGLTNGQILSLLKDREGNLWVGTADGVFKYYNDRFIYYTRFNDFLSSSVDKVAVDAQGNMWVAIAANGLVRITDGKMTTYLPKKNDPNSLPDKNVNAFLLSDEGIMFFGTDNGLCAFANGKFKQMSNKIFHNNVVQSLFQDSRKKIWIGTKNGVFSIVKGEITEEVGINSFDSGENQLDVFCIGEDRSGKLLFGLENGMLQYDGKKLKHIDNNDNFVNYRVTSIQSDLNNNLWFGTGAGLLFYDYKSYKKILNSTGSSFGYVNFLQFDNKNKLYIGTNNGTDILHLNYFYLGKVRVKHLGVEDGLLAKECLYHSSAMDHKGRILIGSANGLTVYDPYHDRFNKNEAKTSITDIKLFFGEESLSGYSKGIDSSSFLPRNLILPYTKNNLTFHFIGISLLIPQKVMYTYKLQGLDKNWSPAVSSTQASYPSLPPGKYTFMVKARNNDGLWNRIPTKYSFEILYPWYRTWWFYALCVVSVAGAVVIYNTTRTRKLRADKLKLEKIVHQRTSELRAEKEKVEIINKEVVEQKTEIENKNLEITDSIRYAKNIQEALLPSLSETENAFKNCFILYLPKDIVSGDFFWFAETEEVKLIAAADCTGHGVPGAFMSIVGNTLLNEIVEQEKVQRPGDILLELHKSVKIALNQNSGESERRDGMDIALCSISKTKNQIEFAGANRPLWIYRNNKGYELEIIKATKHPIGGLEMDQKRSYETVSIDVFEGDVLYFFSDGFADQFGGPKGKKFMISNLQKLLLDNIELPMRKQKENIKKAFDDWKMDTEQIDDVLVIGIRI